MTDSAFIAATAGEASAAYQDMLDRDEIPWGSVRAEFDHWFPQVAVVRAEFDAHHQRDQAAWDETHPMPADLMDAYPPSFGRTDWSQWTVDAHRRLEIAVETALSVGDRVSPLAQAADAASPVGLMEIADRLRVERQTARNWQQRGVLPPHRWTVSGRPAWSWTRDIEPWARQTGRSQGTRSNLRSTASG